MKKHLNTLLVTLTILSLSGGTSSNAKENQDKNAPNAPHASTPKKNTNDASKPTPGLVGPSPGLISHTFPITIGSDLPIDKENYPEIERLRRINISQEALNWTKPGMRPVVGDDFVVRISDDRIVKILIKSVSITSRGIMMGGIFDGGLGSAQILFIDQRAYIVLHDVRNKKNYLISYDLKNKSYTLRQIDTTRLPKGEL